MFRFYIIDTFGNPPTGTNDEATARDFSYNEDFIVIDSELATHLLGDVTEVIEESAS